MIDKWYRFEQIDGDIFSGTFRHGIGRGETEDDAWEDFAAKLRADNDAWRSREGWRYGSDYSLPDPNREDFAVVSSWEEYEREREERHQRHVQAMKQDAFDRWYIPTLVGVMFVAVVVVQLWPKA